jgi:hypothetical protein
MQSWWAMGLLRDSRVFGATGAARVDLFSTVFPGMVWGQTTAFPGMVYRISGYGLGSDYRIAGYGLPHFRVWFEVASGLIIGLAASLLWELIARRTEQHQRGAGGGAFSTASTGEDHGRRGQGPATRRPRWPAPQKLVQS